jgi:hypothetical protein
MEKALYATGFNDVVFWHRYLAGNNPLERIWSRICVQYRFCAQWLYNRLNKLRGRMTAAEIKSFEKGVRDGWQWLKTEEYQKLSPVLEE